MATRKNTSLFIFKFFIFALILFLSIYFFEKNKNFKKTNSQFFSSQNLSFFLHSIQKTDPEPQVSIVKKGFLQANLPPFFILPRVFTQIINDEVVNNEIIAHEIQKGETLISIAKKYNLNPKTIIWANNLENETLQAGKEIIILPTDGVLHVVKKGEKLEEIVKKYKGDLEKTLSFNELTSPEEIFEGQLLIIPGGEIPEPPKPKPQSFVFSTNNYFGKSYSYPYGYCTWWVAQKRAVPSLGNAKDWLRNAKALGFDVCFGSQCPPKKGAIVSLKTRHSLGHVAYVEEVLEGKILISEMNYAGLGVMTKRYVKIGDPRILGYIY